MNRSINHRKVSMLFLCIFFCGLANTINAQKKNESGLPDEIMAWTKSTMNPFSYKRYRSLKHAMIANNFYIPLVFRGGIFPTTNFQFDPASALSDSIPAAITYESPSEKNMFKSYLLKKALAEEVYKNVLLKDPQNFEYAAAHLPKNDVRQSSIEEPYGDIRVNVKASVADPEKVEPVIKFIPDRKYWTSSFSADVKFSQNKTSSNWYKGEIDNMNIYANTEVSYNYAKEKASLTNTLSSTFIIHNAPKDTLRDYTIGNNELRFRSNFGYKAISNWNYSASGEFITSISDKYVVNSNVKNSAFLAPYTVNLGMGMTYALKPKFKKKHRSLDLSLSIEPLSFKYMYSIDQDIALGSYFQKNEDGTYKYKLQAFGSTITMKKTTKFNRNVSWSSRLYFFTSYDRAIGEFENKLDVALSRYFSTMFYLYLRYDDGVSKSPDSDTYLQVNEMFSFGFSYKW